MLIVNNGWLVRSTRCGPVLKINRQQQSIFFYALGAILFAIFQLDVTIDAYAGEPKPAVEPAQKKIPQKRFVFATENWYAPREIRYNHLYPDYFRFLEGRWESEDKKFTENWSFDANGHLIGLRTIAGFDYSERERDLFAVEGTSVAPKVYFRRLNAHLDNLNSKEQFDVSGKSLVAHRCTISCRSNFGLQIINQYDCPSKNQLKIEIDTNGVKKTVNLRRIL